MTGYWSHSGSGNLHPYYTDYRFALAYSPGVPLNRDCYGTAPDHCVAEPWSSLDPWRPDALPADGPLDAIVSSFTESVSGGPVDAFLRGKRESVASQATTVLGMIYEREKLLDDNLCSIEYDASIVKTRWLDLKDWCRPGVNSDVDKLRTKLEQDLLAFEREKRLEQNGCWSDVARLKSQLTEVLGEFRQQTNRQDLLSRGGDGTWMSEKPAGN